MHLPIDSYTLPPDATTVAIIGLLPSQLANVVHLFTELGIEVIDGGSISDGSNMARKARNAIAKADVAFLNVKHARTLKAEDVGRKPLVHFGGIASLKKLIDRTRAERDDS